MVIILRIFLLIFILKHINCGKPNVCKEIDDYLHIKNNPNCWYNPDVYLQFEEIARGHGYPLEEHTITTKDGYISTIFRLPRPGGKVVICEPAMTVTSTTYIKTANSSIGFTLYDNGYDVWFGNFRGTYYSRNHTFLNDNDGKYWDYSFHELGVYDFPAHFDYIKNKTQGKFVVISYSMAGAVSLIYASTYPQHASKHIELFINIAPTVFSKTINGIDGDAIYNLVTQGLNSYTGFTSYEGARSIVRFNCGTFPFAMLTCLYHTTKYAGGSPSNIKPEFLPLIFYDNPTRVSHKHIAHYNQIAQAHRFQPFDYGKFGNLLRYNSVQPPAYNLTEITVPIITFYGGRDASCVPNDVLWLNSILRNETKIYLNGLYLIENYNHIDYFFAKDCKEKVADEIIKILKMLP